MMEPTPGKEDAADSVLWRDVCLASAWFDRAQKLGTSSGAVNNSEPEIIECAERALSLYQGCFTRVKKRSSSAALAASAAASDVSPPLSSKSTTTPQDPPTEADFICINLELRMAQTLRFLAAVCAASDDNYNNNNVDEQKEEGDGNDEEKVDNKDDNNNFKAAIQYHDDAVSLLVGVFEDDESQYSGEEEKLAGGLSLDGENNECQLGALDEKDHFSTPAGDDATAMMGTNEGNSSNILLAIPISSNATLLQYTNYTSHQQPSQVVFLMPAEEQRVRAIAMSLNAMAELHAKHGNDGAAMESYREALEILRAASDEQEEDYEEDNESFSKKMSRVEIDLANTLHCVGNFHLRRDELDAAFNAYSTVWALYNGSDDMVSSSSQDGVKGVSPSVTRKTLPTLPEFGSPRLNKKTATLNSDNNATTTLESFPPGALVALNNLGIVHERRGELDDALSCFHQVLSARIESLGNDHFDTAHSFVNIGNCYQRKLDWEKATVAYKESASIYRKKLVHLRQRSKKNSTSLNQIDVIKLHRSLAGVLRNWGTCCWKQGRISEAIDLMNQSVNTEERVKSDALEVPVPKDIVRQASESMAQLLGILGCMYVEYNLKEQRSFENSEGAFTMAIQIYEDLGYNKTNPSVVWASNNLAAVRLMGVRSMTPPPPPEPTPPTQSNTTNLTSTKGMVQNDEVDFDEIDSVGLDEVLGDDGKDDSLFSGVDDSTEELDEILADARQPKAMEDHGAESKRIIHDGSPRTFTSDQNRSEGESNEDKETFLIQQKGSYGDESIEAAEAHISLAQHLWEKGNRISATEHYTEAHAIFHSRLGESKEVAMILKSLGDLQKEDEQLEASKELYEEALDMEMAVFGYHLPQTLNAAGVVSLMLDDFRSAMEYHRRALQIQKKSLAAENKYEMFETLVLIGNVYYSEQNNLSNIRTKGVDYTDFIESGFLGWIANAHDMRGEYGKAIQFYEESLQMAMSRSGKESKKETALTLNRLGSLTRELGRYDEAMDYHKRALSIQKSKSQHSEAMTAETCVLMGMVKAKTGEYKNALNLFDDAVDTLRNALGENHLSVTKTLAQIGALYFELSRYDEAFEKLQEAERIQLETVGEMNRDTLETQALIGRVLSATGEYESASIKLNSVVEKQHSLFGSSHPSIAETKQFIAGNFLQQGMSAEARAVFVEVYNMRKGFFTMDQIQMAESMVDVIRARNGRPERALAIYRNAMDVYREYLPDDHVLIGRLLVYEGDVHAELLSFSTAIERYEEARKIFRKSVGENAIDSAHVAVNIGKVMLRKCDYDGAKEEFNAALSNYQQLLPGNHPKMSSVLNHLSRVEEEEALCV